MARIPDGQTPRATPQPSRGLPSGGGAEGLQRAASSVQSYANVAGSGLMNAGQQFEQYGQKLQRRRDTIEMSRSRSGFYKDITDYMAASKETDDWTTEETVTSFYGAVRAKQREYVENFKGSNDARARLQAELEEQSQRFAIDGAAYSISATKTVIGQEMDMHHSKAWNEAYGGTGPINETVQEYERWVDANKDGMTDAEEQGYRDRVPDIYAGAILGMIHRGQVDEADQFINSPEGSAFLGPQNLESLHKQSMAMRQRLRDGEKDRASNPTTFYHPKTKDEISIDINSPGGRARSDKLMADGYHPISKSVTAQNTEDAFAAPSKAFVADYTKRIASSETTVDLTSRIRDQVNSGTFTGITGEVISGLDNLVNATVQMRDALGMKGEAALLDETLYEWPAGADAAKSAVFKSNVLRLAYLDAMQMEPGARLTNEDVQRAITRVGGNISSKGQINALLDNVDTFTRISTTNFHDAMVRQYPDQQFPALPSRLRYERKEDAAKPIELPPGIPEGSKKGKATLPDGTVIDAYQAPDGNVYPVPAGQ